MSKITVSNLTFAYEGSYDTIFEKVSFQLDTDWKLGLIGRNGRGKTTLLNLLMGKHRYDGKISTSASFEYFPLTVRDEEECAADVFAGDAPLWKIQKEVSLMETDEGILYRPFYTLSGGEKTRVMMAALFARETDFLLLDEPTNHLDLQAREQMGDYLRKKKGFILVSHDRILLDQCVDHILSINRASIEIQKGNFSTWNENRIKRDAFEQAEHQKLHKEMRRLKQAKEQAAGWSDRIEKTKNGQKVSGIKPDKGHIGAQAAKMMKRSKALENRRQAKFDETSELLKNTEHTFELKLEPLTYYASRLLTMENLQVYYGASPACAPVSLTLHQGERIALKGRNGSGKSSILKLIRGENVTFSGEFQRGSRLKISYVPQNTEGLCGSLSAYAKECAIDESRFRAILNKLDFSRLQMEKDMESFSQGQKKKVLIARSLCESAHLYLWDEPLNYIDVFSRMQIEQLLLEFKPAMIFVEHDRAFASRIADREVLL
ncbi:MAG: ABC-F type ribosomal protection protein [Firmicutes bacterium]|nr:ABC-F type ribosomal protection protein [Bacillota bacterium]